MTSKNETKYDRFLRLGQKRVTHAMDQLRLVSQLASRDYEYYPEEAEKIVRYLDGSVRRIAEVFGVEYATRIGKVGARPTNGAQPLVTIRPKAPLLDEVALMHTLEHLRAGRTEEVERILRLAIRGTAEPA